MGRISSGIIKRTAKKLVEEGKEFTNKFDNNKNILKHFELPDKRTRNKIAGYITRLKKSEKHSKINKQ